jgi:hypothetical protein
MRRGVVINSFTLKGALYPSRCGMDGWVKIMRFSNSSAFIKYRPPPLSVSSEQAHHGRVLPPPSPPGR